MSLRGRLVLVVLTVAAAGLVAVDVVSYTALRAYLSDRIDGQLSAAFAPAAERLDDAGPGGPGGAGGPPGGEGPPPPPSGEPPGPPPGEGERLAPGTYAELRDADGATVGDPVRFEFDSDAELAPALPDSLATSPSPSELATQDVSAGDGDGSFRVAAVAAPGGGGRVLVVAVPLDELDSTLSRLLAIVAAVSAVVLVAVAALAWWVVGLGLRPRRRIEATARGISAGELERRAEDTSPRTEAGRLGMAFNEMVDRLGAALAEREASENRLRRFLADASHELRTPLSSIRGYAELFRLGAASDPAQIELALARIEGESKRMGVLVDDLLALARSDEQRTPVRRPTDVGALVVEIGRDATVAEPDREIVVIDDSGATLVAVDPEQVRRAISNLVRNAVIHTPSGTPVEIRAAGSADGVEVTVRDHGTGLEPGSERLVFERFWRSSGDSARAARQGSGLGLAIVAAVAEAHGGGATAEQAAGGGAMFRLWLPLESPDPAA